MRGFHVNWTRPFAVRAPGMPYAIEPFELLTTALSALFWRRENGSICMVCDSRAAEYYASIGLDFLWDDGMHPLLDAMPDDINATAFWAAGKLYAVAAMKAPCVMLDTDLICWKNIDALLDGADAAAIHREDIIPSIYPGKSAFSRSNGFDFDAFDWSVQPLNTALCSFSDDDFRRFYADTAIRFMRSAPQADDTLTYMVFAEQRLLAMCAEKAHIRIRALSDLPSLFGGAQNGYFSHVWGFKQQMRENPALYEDFCRRCAARLRRDFPAEAEKIARIPALSVFFDENKAQRR